jgi:hypothetical protein
MMGDKSSDAHPNAFMSVTPVPYQAKWAYQDGAAPQPSTHALTFPRVRENVRNTSIHRRKGRPMGNIELAETLRTFKDERAKVRTKLAMLGKAIAVLEELGAISLTSNGRRTKRPLSAASRRKIAAARRLPG